MIQKKSGIVKIQTEKSFIVGNELYKLLLVFDF